MPDLHAPERRGARARHLGLLAVVLLAPAPAPRPARPCPAPAGWMRMQWGKGEFLAYFAEGGGYWCLAAPTHYTGRWRLEGRVLTMTESEVPRHTGDGWHWTTHHALLEPGTTRGSLGEGGMRFGLAPCAPPPLRSTGWLPAPR